MRLLKVNNDLELEIVPEVLLIPEFSKAVNTGKDDPRKVLAYVFHMASEEGPYASYEPKERQSRLANDLFNNHKWKPSKEIEAAIEKYKELNHTPASKTVTTIINALHKTNKIIDTLINEIESNLTEEKYKQGVTNKQGQIVTGVEIMLGDIQALLKAANEVPKTIDIFEKLQEKILKEKQVAASKFRGGAEISDFER